MEEPIDFEQINCRTLTKQFQVYQKQHPKSQIKSVEEFAKNIEQNPSHYQPKTVQRAQKHLKTTAQPPPKEDKLQEKPDNIRLKYGSGVSFSIPSIHSE